MPAPKKPAPTPKKTVPTKKPSQTPTKKPSQTPTKKPAAPVPTPKKTVPTKKPGKKPAPPPRQTYAPIIPPPPQPPLPSTKIGTIRYRLTDGAQNAPPEIRRRIVDDVEKAVDLYNRFIARDIEMTVDYNPNVPTAQALGTEIAFGSMFGYRATLHELGHVFGAGFHPAWREVMRDGVWTGPRASQKIKELDGPDAVLRGDAIHFWPYGLNQDGEYFDGADIRHATMMAAMLADLDDRLGRTWIPGS